jgi:hypothetical protein
MIYSYSRLAIWCNEDFLALQEDPDLLANWINDHDLTLN